MSTQKPFALNWLWLSAAIIAADFLSKLSLAFRDLPAGLLSTATETFPERAPQMPRANAVG